MVLSQHFDVFEKLIFCPRFTKVVFIKILWIKKANSFLNDLISFRKSPTEEYCLSYGQFLRFFQNFCERTVFERSDAYIWTAEEGRWRLRWRVPEENGSWEVDIKWALKVNEKIALQFKSFIQLKYVYLLRLELFNIKITALVTWRVYSGT